MKTARILSAGMAVVLLQGNVAWAQMAAAAAHDGFPETLTSTGTASLTGLDRDTTGASPAVSSAAIAEIPLEAPSGATAKASAPAAPGSSALIEPISAEPIDFNFKDTDIVGILRTFAVKFGKNIIAAPGVSGKVNIQLHRVPFDEAFRILLDQMGLVAIQRSGNVIEVIKAANMPILVQVFPLKYRFALDLQPMLITTLDAKEKLYSIVSVDNASNSVIVTSTNDILQKMKTLISQVDIPSPQIAIKARLIEVASVNNLSWGINWAGASFNGNTRVRSIKDQGNYAVLPDGTIAVGNAVTQFPTGGILDVSSVMNKTQLYAMLNFIKTDTRNKTISEPMILTGNNKVAKIHVGQNLPVITSQVTQTATTQSVQYIPEGVDLEVTPIVSPGSTVISFKVRINVSELVGFQVNNPITSERVATTEVAIESGMTVVIGGLIKDTMADAENGIPLLKDIPVLGWLFKNKTKNKARTELLIFITPELQPRSV